MILSVKSNSHFSFSAKKFGKISFNLKVISLSMSRSNDLIHFFISANLKIIAFSPSYIILYDHIFEKS